WEALGWNGHRVPRARVAASVGLVGSHGEAGKASDFDAFTCAQRVRHRVEHAADHQLGTRLRAVSPGSKCVDQLALGHAHTLRQLPKRPATPSRKCQTLLYGYRDGVRSFRCGTGAVCRDAGRLTPLFAVATTHLASVSALFASSTLGGATTRCAAESTAC